MKTTLLLLFAALLCPLPSRADLSPQERTQEWERRYHDRIGGTLLWDAARNLAVAYANSGADAEHYLYHCFRRRADGSMELFACYSTRSNFLHHSAVELTPTGIRITLSDGERTRFAHEFSFEQASASLELNIGKETPAAAPELQLLRD